MEADTQGHTLATYREIADRFGLGSVRAARTKVKRAGWPHEPANHPADPLRIRVPGDLWHQAADARPDRLNDAEGIDPDRDRDAQSTNQRDPGHQKGDARGTNRFDVLFATLREQLERERARADASEAELKSLRERLIELAQAEAAARTKADLSGAEVERLRAAVEAGKGSGLTPGWVWLQDTWRSLRARSLAGTTRAG